MKFFNNFSFRKLLYNKKFAITLSILAAFVFWLVIVLDQNPEREEVIRDVPIEISTEGTVWGDQGLEVINDITQKATVSVHGPNYIVSSLKNEDVKIVADLSPLNGAGNYTISLSAVRNSDVNGYSFVSISPSTVSVQFDYIESKEFTVIPKVEGYNRVDGLTYDDAVVANAEEEKLLVKGPRSVVSKISSVIAYAYTEKRLSTTTSFESELQFLDADGKEVDVRKLVINKDNIMVSVPVSKTKTFKFIPTFINAPNQNVIKALNERVVCDVSEFTVAGAPDVIDSLTNVEFTPIDVTKITSKSSNQTFEVKPNLPNGVRITDGIEAANVSFNLNGFTVKKIKINNFDSADTLAKDLTVSYPNDCSVEVCGDKAIINALSTDVYYLSLDLSNVNKGESMVKAIVKTMNNSVVWQTAVCEIKVVVK